jgi:hypothetical protein
MSGMRKRFLGGKVLFPELRSPEPLDRVVVNPDGHRVVGADKVGPKLSPPRVLDETLDS